MIHKVRLKSVEMDTSGDPQTAIVSFEVLTVNNHVLLEESLVVGSSLHKLTQDEIVELAWDKIEERVEQRAGQVDSKDILTLQSDEEYTRNLSSRVDPDVKTIVDTLEFDELKTACNIHEALTRLTPVTANYIRSVIA